MMILLTQYQENKNERKKEMNALTQQIVLETIQELNSMENEGVTYEQIKKRLKEKYPDLPLSNLSNRLIRLKKWKDIRKDINDNKYYLN